MPKWFAPAVLVSLCMFALGVAGLVFVSGIDTGDDDTPWHQPVGLDQLELLDFRLFDQDGNIVDRSIFDGEITVLNFFFTNCVLVCPQMNGETYGMTLDLADTDVSFVSISVDPDHDTIDVIKKYGGDFDADPEQWRFLTGEREQIERIVRKGFLFEVGPDDDPNNIINLSDGSSMPNLYHPSKFFLVGPDRRILGLYSYLIEEDIEELVDRARTLDELNR